MGDCIVLIARLHSSWLHRHRPCSLRTIAASLARFFHRLNNSVGIVLPLFGRCTKGGTCFKCHRSCIERENLLKGMVPDAIPLE